MLIEYLLSAFLLGIVVAIPPGSVTIVACQRALQYGFRNSIFFTLGSSLSDVFYLVLVFIGVANIISASLTLKVMLWIVCGLLLIGLGAASLFALKKSRGNEKGEKRSLSVNPLYTFISGVLVTLTNPMTIVGWIAVAGNFYLVWDARFPGSRNYAVVTIVLIMAGVLAWFLPLTFTASRLKRIMSEKLKTGLIIFSNICLMAFGLVALYYACRVIFSW